MFSFVITWGVFYAVAGVRWRLHTDNLWPLPGHLWEVWLQRPCQQLWPGDRQLSGRFYNLFLLPNLNLVWYLSLSALMLFSKSQNVESLSLRCVYLLLIPISAFFMFVEQKQCLHNTAGPRCERCESGFYGNPAAGGAHACQPCPCPGTTPSSQWVRVWLSAVQVINLHVTKWCISRLLLR